MAKSPVFWIWIGATTVAAAANVVWARDQNALGPMALVAINLAAMVMTAVFVGTAMLRGLRSETSNLEERTTKD